MTIEKKMEKEIVICDLTNCLNCGNCIIACERRHKDISRHTRAISTIIGISLFPNLCMVCNDPKCIEVCNHEGMARDEHGHIIVTDNCIGCGLCMRVCPYNAILFFPGQDRRSSFMDKVIDFIKPKGNGNGLGDRNGKKEDIIDLKRVEGIIAGYGEGAGSLLNTLQDIQDDYGYLSQEVLIHVSKEFEIPLTQVFQVVTFNRGFNLIPKERLGTEGSTGTTWHLWGCENTEETSDFENTDFNLKVNEKKCISCGLCVKACEEVSGACAIRFSKQVIYGEIKKPFLEFPEACTGCGECAKVCPTKAITLDYEVEKIRIKQKVVKCDGCAGYNDRACVVNCPTGALKAIPLDEYLSQHKISYNIELRDLLKQSLEEKGTFISP